MTALHTLGILSTSFIRNAFPTVLKEFPHMLSTCWLLFLHSAVQLLPNHLNWIEVGWLWRPGHLMQHSITFLFSQIALTQPGGVLGVIFFLFGPVRGCPRMGPQCLLTPPVSASGIYVCCSSLCVVGLGSVCYIWSIYPVLSGVLCEFKYALSNSLFLSFSLLED